MLKHTVRPCQLWSLRVLQCQAARDKGGHVLLHCSQGVSRSAALAIAHHMWQADLPYDEAFSAVKAARGIANPNLGFTCQVCAMHGNRRKQVKNGAL